MVENKALTNAYFSLIKTILALDVKKPDSVFLDLDKFLDLDIVCHFISNLSTPTSLSSISLPSSLLLSRPALLSLSTPTPFFSSRVKDSVLFEIFNIQISSATIRLNP